MKQLVLKIETDAKDLLKKLEELNKPFAGYIKSHEDNNNRTKH